MTPDMVREKIGDRLVHKIIMLETHERLAAIGKNVSSVEFGRMVGRDHTTILANLGRTLKSRRQKSRGKGKRPIFSEKDVERLRTLVAAGFGMDEIFEATSWSMRSIRYYVRFLRSRDETLPRRGGETTRKELASLRRLDDETDYRKIEGRKI
jgi:hypothetical protein